MSKKIVIKKYPNRKLYNTDTASYISYKDIVEMIKAGSSVMVVDNRTKQDITRFTLTQILFQKEREYLKSLPEATLESAIKHETGLISSSLTQFGPDAEGDAARTTQAETNTTANITTGSLANN